MRNRLPSHSIPAPASPTTLAAGARSGPFMWTVCRPATMPVPAGEDIQGWLYHAGKRGL